MNASDYQAAGLYDPDAENATDRLALLEWLAAEGMTLEEMVEAHARQSLPGILAQRTLRPGRRLTLAEAAERAGITIDEAERLRRAVGFPAADPEDRIFSAADAEAFAAFKVAMGVLGEEAILDFSRVIGSSLARIAESAIWLFLQHVEAPLAESHAGELALARANVDAIKLLVAVPAVMDPIFRFHVETAIRRSRLARDMGSYDTSRLAVGFVDLVGFTTVSQQLSTRDLAELIQEFESQAFEVVTARGGRLVKMIGDEVMFVTIDADAACEITLTLFETLGEDRAVTPRAGLAVGPLITRGGDYYGPVVNLASRIADLAVPSEILVTAELRDAAEKPSPELHFDPAGRRMLKGFDEPIELFSLTRAE
jgi:adenylate cyclase